VRIVILSRDSTLFSCRRLYTAASARGHIVDFINPIFCYIDINDSKYSIFYLKKKLEYYDAVIPRIGSTTTLHNIAILRQLEILGSFPINCSYSISKARNKLHCLQLLAYKGINLPNTSFSCNIENSETLINMVGGAPVIIKKIEGAQGIGVILAETKQMAKSIIDTFLNLNVQFLVQEFISEANGCDIRCLVIGNKVVTAIERRAKEGDFRSNLHCGGTAKKTSISFTEQKIAILSAKILGLNVAGVDILRSNRGPLVIEVNSSPGLQGVETESGFDIATMIILFIENYLSK